MKYEFWKYEDEFGGGWYLVPVDHQYEAFLRYRETHEPDSEIVCSVEAETEEEAEALIREHLGWPRREPAADD